MKPLNQDEGGQNEQALQRVGDAYILPGRIEAVEQEQAEAKKRDERYKDQQLVFDQKLVRYTFWLFVVGAVGACIAVWQSCSAQRAADAARVAADAATSASTTAANALADSSESFEKTLKQMEAQTEAAYIGGQAAREAAEQARRSADTADTTARFTREFLERPYVGFKSLTPLDFVADKVPTLVLEFENFGRTRAINVKTNITQGFRCQGLERTLVFDEGGGTFQTPSIGPNSTAIRYSTVSDPKWPALFKQIQTPPCTLFIFGYIEYADMAGKKYPREEYCLFYARTPNRPATLSPFDVCTDR